MEASMFESSETLATFVASTPLLAESWKLCSRLAVDDSHFAVINRVDDGEAAYVAFSGIKMAVSGVGVDQKFVALSCCPDRLFSAALCHRIDGRDQPMVHAGLLNLFLSFYNDTIFRHQMVEVMNTSKSVVITGHSIGGAIASLFALWILSQVQSTTKCSVICITFGSPMLGNECLSDTILQERWGGHFVHVVSQNDIVPRLIIPVASSNQTDQLSVVLDSLNQVVSSKGLDECNQKCASSFWPFGSYLFCTNSGAVCVDNGMVIVKLLYLTLLNGGSPSCSLNNHLGYTNFIQKAHVWQFIESRRSFNLPELSYEAGINLALESLGIASHDSNSDVAREALERAKRSGRTRNLNSSDLAIGLSKINPLRAQIEWYQASCDNSDDQMGYYDSFKRRGASKRDFKVNMNRIKLAKFWDSVIDKWETNQLPYDFHKRAKWVYASHSYKLLAEPLDIAEYYKSGMHCVKGHYVQNGRERRYKIFEKWWNDQNDTIDDTTTSSRSRFASLTQDSCFWAHLEEARDSLVKVRAGIDAAKSVKMLEHITQFDQYARRLIQNKEVSVDVFAKNSSYTLFMEEWNEFQSQSQLFQPRVLPSQGSFKNNVSTFTR